MINRKNYVADPAEQIDRAVLARLSMLQTSMPGIVQSFSAEALTCDIQPALKERIEKEDGSTEWVLLPLLRDCPVVFPHAGGCSLTFPVKAGDEVLIVFASRCIDGWWANGGVNPPLEYRMHDLSDGFCIPGIWSQPRKIGNVSTEAVELRSDDRAAYISIRPDSHLVELKTTGSVKAAIGGSLNAEISGSATIKAAQITLDAPNVICTGNIFAKGDITDMNGAATMAGMRSTYNRHTHNGGSSPDQKM